jgi:oligoendopeptidase F
MASLYPAERPTMPGMSDAALLEDPELTQTAWNLADLVDGEGEEGVHRRLDEALERSRAFAERHAGKVAEFGVDDLRDAMTELVAIHDLAARAGYYASLAFSVDTADPRRGALMQKVQERSTELQTLLLFFDLEWAALDDDRAEELLAGEGLDFCRHHLRSERRYRPHLLSEPEEKILAEKGLTGRSAWTRLFEEQTAALTVDLPDEDEPVKLELALARLQGPDRDARRTAAEAVTTALGTDLRSRAYVFNTLLADKMVDDRLRSYPHWLASRNLSNEASDESVEALVSAVRNRYALPRRWYKLKARLLGIDRLADYDRMAPVATEEQRIAWPEARDLVRDTYGAFSSDLGDIVGRFFDEAWIDAPVRPGKRGGAFCAYATPDVHPYVMLNYTARRRDVLTLAHELGHGVHAALGASQGLLQQSTPLTLAETASVFGETIVLRRLLGETESADARLGLLAESIDGAVATVFRQVAMNRYEHLVHTARREEGELSVDRFGELWRESQEEMLGDAVEITEGYTTWWSYIPHFIASPGYVYAYAYGQLLALSVYGKYREEGEDFVPRYLEMLSAGGSKPPEEIAAIAGIDLADPGFWDAGLDLVEGQLEEAEQTAQEAGRA